VSIWGIEMRSLRVLSVWAVVAVFAAFVVASPAVAQVGAIRITTPYPSIAVQPGATVRFELSVTAPSPQTVALDVAEVPSGWTTTLRGGGFVIGGVTAEPDKAGTATLEVKVSPTVAPGTYGFDVRGSGPSGTGTLSLEFRVQRVVDAGIGITADFPSLKGEPSSTFTYTLTITNNTPTQQVFTFAPTGPQGWNVTASPSAESRANTATIEAGATSQVKVSATPPATAEQGQYPIHVDVSAASGATGRIELTAEVAGTPKLQIASADERLNVEGRANKVKRLPIIVSNPGTAPLTDVKFAATSPKDWEVRFEPETLAEVLPNEAAQVTAVIKPTKNAVAGDYALTVRASAGSHSSSLDFRYGITGSRWLGVAGVGLIVVAVVAMFGVFRRFGRR
jgi:uncharacterized membrane protein